MTKPPVRRKAPWPLLGAMMSMVVVFIILATATQQWQFLILGLVGLFAALVPFLNRD